MAGTENVKNRPKINIKYFLNFLQITKQTPKTLTASGDRGAMDAASL